MYKVNPIATILAAKMMLDWIGETAKGAAVEAAVAEVIKDGQARTYDMGGKSTSLDVGRAVAAKL
jgi:isocitrate/isopropylmalate dehydrogenase